MIIIVNGNSIVSGCLERKKVAGII